MNKWRKYIKTQMVVALIVSAVLAFILSYVLSLIGSLCVDEYLSRSKYIERASFNKLEEFQDYVTQNNLSSKSKDSFSEWENQQKSVQVFLQIQKNGVALYDSLDVITENDEYRDEYYSNAAIKYVKFSDGRAKVYLTGYFDSQMYTYEFLIVMTITVIAFIAIFLRFVNVKIKYIKELEEDIKVLETGGLDYEIRVKGRDELGMLADGLNKMRLALMENIENEELAMEANRKIVVSLAHDLRTPLTALRIYLDLLYTGKNLSDEQKTAYLEKALVKTTQIQRMSEQLFEKFLVPGGDDYLASPPQSIAYTFDDIMSDMIGYLTQQGFQVETSIQWPAKQIIVNMDYLCRIFDNISSNILKYAGRKEPIVIKTIDGENFSVEFSNVVSHEEVQQTGSSVGVKNVATMIGKMGGTIDVEQDENRYCIRLNFPYSETQ